MVFSDSTQLKGLFLIPKSKKLHLDIYYSVKIKYKKTIIVGGGATGLTKDIGMKKSDNVLLWSYSQNLYKFLFEQKNKGLII
jgi:hypothetical protein